MPGEGTGDPTVDAGRLGGTRQTQSQQKERGEADQRSGDEPQAFARLGRSERKQHGETARQQQEGKGDAAQERG
jgi:hypothetical protein